MSGGFNILAIGMNPEAPAGGVSYTEISDYWTKTSVDVPVFLRILSWFITEPFSVVELVFRKSALFWDAMEITSNLRDYDVIKGFSSSLAKFAIIPTSALLAGFLSFGAVFLKTLKGRRTVLFPFLAVLAYWISLVPFIIATRYRVPVIPLLALFTAMFVERGFGSLQLFVKRWKRVCLGLVAGLFIAFLLFPLYRYNLEGMVIGVIRPQGTIVSLDDKTMYLDNGPYLFGSHVTFPFEAGDVLEKKFSIRDSDSGAVSSLQIPVRCIIGREIRMRINGVLYSAIPRGPGDGELLQYQSISNSTLSFPVRAPEDGRFTIELVYPDDGSIILAMDAQRNHGRTLVNGGTVKAELVCRLMVHHQK